MTRQHRVSMSLDEVLAVRVVCAKCSASISFPLELPAAHPQNCPGCGSVLRDRSAPDSTFEDLIDAIRDARRMAAMRATLPSTLYLEFADDAQSA